MPTLRVPAGVVRGESRAMVPGRYYHTSLVRWHEGNLKPIGGWDRITPQPLASIPRAGHTWIDRSFRQHKAFLCDAHIYRVQDNAYSDITPADFTPAASAGTRGYGAGNYGVAAYGRDDDPRGGTTLTDVLPVTHTLDNWNDELLVGSSADGRIWVWSPENPTPKATLAAGVPNLPQTFLCTEEHHLMVFGGDGYPNRVAWSDQGNREGWNYASTTGQAGFFDLESAGQILTARKIPGGILVFTQTSVWLGTYLGAPYYYGFNKIAEHVAPISPQAVVVAAGKAYWMARRTFHKFEGGIVQPLPCTLDLDPSEDMDMGAAPARVCGGFNGVYPEIWWFYPSAGQNVPQVENDRYCVFNFVDGWWCDGYLDRTFFSADLIEGYPMAGRATRHVVQHERGYLAEGLPREGTVWAEVSTVSFDDAENNWSVTQAQVDGRREAGADAKAVRFDFSGVNSRGAEYRALGSWTANAQGYMDTRFTARDFSFRVVGLRDVPWSVGAINFRAVKRAGR